MSSSRTSTTLVDVTMPQMGVSVAEGTVVAWRVERRRPDRGRADDLRDLDRQDRHRGAAPASGVVAEILVPVDTTVAVGEVLARIATDGGGADAPARAGDEADQLRRPAPTKLLRPTGPSRGGCSRPARGRRPPATPTALARRSGRRYSPVVQRIAAEHDDRPEQVPGTGRGGRVRKQDVLAFARERRRRGRSEAPLHIESPYRPEPTAPRRRRPAVADAAPDRRAHEALAGDGRPLHDLDRGRHEPDRGGAGAARADRAAVRRARGDRRAARAPGAERLARGRALHRPPRA